MCGIYCLIANISYNYFETKVFTYVLLTDKGNITFYLNRKQSKTSAWKPSRSQHLSRMFATPFYLCVMRILFSFTVFGFVVRHWTVWYIIHLPHLEFSKNFRDHSFDNKESSVLYPWQSRSWSHQLLYRNLGYSLCF